MLYNTNQYNVFRRPAIFNQYIMVLLFFFLIVFDINEVKAQVGMSNQEIVNVMKNVCDYELANPHYSSNWQRNLLNGWVRATFYPGLLAMYRVSNEEKYINEAVAWGDTVQWMPAPRFRHADDIVCGASYIEMYEIFKKPVMIKAIKERIDSIMLQPLSGREDWWWCDALYMAPQVYAKLGALTGEEKYFKYLHEQFFDAVDYLYDKEESLFYRDNRYFDKRSLNDKKVFWSRGNGWVFAGIPRVLDKLAENDPYRTKYIEIFKQMAERIINLQGEDGLWRASLLDPEEFPMKETSGTAMFCYGLAWGINNNILEKEKYLPALKKAWEGLLSAVNEEGRLRNVQPVGAAPGKYDENNTHCYAVGAFLKAGEQLIIMNQN